MTPAEIAERRYELSVQYGNLSEQLEAILLHKAKNWESFRYAEGVKSDAAAERLWEKTESGQNEIRLRMSIKRNERESSALSSLLRVKEGEAKGIM